MKKILLISPPFTQLNTPYPATAYLKGFLNTKGYESFQADLAIEVILQLFSKAGLQAIFSEVENSELELSENSYRIVQNSADYIETIEPVILFLQHKNPTLAHSICDRSYLPEAYRFQDLDDLDWAFGTMGTQDKARHLATLYLEDLGDLIKEAIDLHFGFSRYAERLGRTATHFDELEAALNETDTLVTDVLLQLLEQKIEEEKPDVVALTIPFPGNLFAALKCGQYIKAEHPHIKVVIGGGYVNTELRTLYDERVFDYVDFVSLDDGEAPLQFLLEYLEGKREKSQLKRIFTKTHGVVSHYNGAIEKDVPQRETGTPDYSDLYLEDYLSVIEIVNPMHRLWSDGRWNKLTLAHGCYWGKCSFCDISLDYIQRYEPLTASLLCDRIETIIEQTQQNGFHFVDEAAPPALMRDLAIEILRRKLTVVWWTNIRFEKSFTADLCRLLKASGCIAVSGGLEVASDRLLARMKKGVTVAQVARVADHFTNAGIMVHAYLMYGFPTQTAQETIDALEMVRQLIENGVVQSGFWHRFAMTAHSPVGLAPAEFEVVRTGPDFGGFADNDLYHDDPLGCDHDLFSEGLRVSLFNYMHGQGFDLPLSDWFDMDTPPPSVPADYIAKSIEEQTTKLPRPHAQVLWLGNRPDYMMVETEDGLMIELTFYKKRGGFSLLMDMKVGEWLVNILDDLQIGKGKIWTFGELKGHFEGQGLGDFGVFFESEEWRILREEGLLVL